MNLAAPQAGTFERWAWDYIASEDLAHKLAPRDPRATAHWEAEAPARRIATPGRPAEFEVLARAAKRPGSGSLGSARGRAQLAHLCLHHELQAAELFAWGVLAFPAAPVRFRRGLVGLVLEEARHARAYAEHVVRLGCRLGDFAVRDWLWQRVTTCSTPRAFVALLGLGFEGGNLEHALDFAARFRAAGDEALAQTAEQVAREEVRHVRFARAWYERWGAALDFERWRAELPAPLTPTLLKGRPLARELRLRAGFDDAFLEALDAWAPSGS